jgi:hypothetical protein
MGSYHDQWSDSAVEAYYGWVDEDTPCGSCGHRLDEHEGPKSKKCQNKYDDCECEEWTEGEYEPPEDDWRDD